MLSEGESRSWWHQTPVRRQSAWLQLMHILARKDTRRYTLSRARELRHWRDTEGRNFGAGFFSAAAPADLHAADEEGAAFLR